MPLNIVIPMAGLGSRFSKAGYTRPKPFIEVAGKLMIERVFENLQVPGARLIAIARREHLEQEQKAVQTMESRFGVQFLPIDLVTEGALCTVLFAHKLINNNDPVLIANSDQIVDISIEAFVRDAEKRHLDGSILTFYNTHPKWSYAKIGPDGLVQDVKEKVPISDHATVGVYLFKNGSEFVMHALDMLIRNERVNGEFYVAPLYNRFIAERARIGIYEIEPEAMHGTGTPEDLDIYLAHLAKFS